MLPEQFHRLLEQAEDESSELRDSVFAQALLPEHLANAVHRVRRRDRFIQWARRHPFHAKYHARSWPQTLTGDEWRTAWADAHDPQTDEALDAVY